MNKALYKRIYRDNPIDHKNPIYVGGYYEKQGGMPAKAFRLLGSALSALTVVLLTLAGSMVSVPAGKVWVALPYAAAYLPAVLGLFACLQAPAHDGRIREDTWHVSLKRVRVYSVLGILLCGFILAAGAAACIMDGVFGRPEGLFLAAAAVNTAVFALLFLLQRKQRYILN